MSKYRNDRRVRQAGRGWTVTDGGRQYRVLHTALGWAVFTGPNLDLIQDGRGRLGYGFSDADAAIRALIGRPRR